MVPHNLHCAIRLMPSVPRRSFSKNLLTNASKFLLGPKELTRIQNNWKPMTIALLRESTFCDASQGMSLEVPQLTEQDFW